MSDHPRHRERTARHIDVAANARDTTRAPQGMNAESNRSSVEFDGGGATLVVMRSHAVVAGPRSANQRRMAVSLAPLS